LTAHLGIGRAERAVDHARAARQPLRDSLEIRRSFRVGEEQEAGQGLPRAVAAA
jgi:hypothetical protein